MARRIGLGIGVLAVAAAAMLAVPVAQTKAAEDSLELIRMGGSGGRLGLGLREVSADDVGRLRLGEERGAFVQEVHPGSAAEKAGLKEGDVIVAYQGDAVHSAAQLSRMVRETPAGRKVSLEVSRGGAVQKLTATLDEQRSRSFTMEGEFPHVELPEIPAPPDIPAPPAAPGFSWKGPGNPRELLMKEHFRLGVPRRLGIQYSELSGQLARYFKVPGERGLLVTDVDEDGPAGKAGLRAGDVILKYDGKAVESPQDFREKLSRSEAGAETTLGVQRDGKPLDVKVKLGGEKKAVRKSKGVTT